MKLYTETGETSVQRIRRGTFE